MNPTLQAALQAAWEITSIFLVIALGVSLMTAIFEGISALRDWFNRGLARRRERLTLERLRKDGAR